MKKTISRFTPKSKSIKNVCFYEPICSHWLCFCLGKSPHIMKRRQQSKLWNKTGPVIPWAVLEYPPVFPDCDESLSSKEMKKCFYEKLDGFIQSELVYPSEANGEEGKVSAYIFLVLMGRCWSKNEV